MAYSTKPQMLDLQAYERFIYSLPQTFPSIRRSTLVVIRRGPILTVPPSPAHFLTTNTFPLTSSDIGSQYLN